MWYVSSQYLPREGGIFYDKVEYLIEYGYKITVSNPFTRKIILTESASIYPLIPYRIDKFAQYDGMLMETRVDKVDDNLKDIARTILKEKPQIKIDSSDAKKIGLEDKRTSQILNDWLSDKSKVVNHIYLQLAHSSHPILFPPYKQTYPNRKDTYLYLWGVIGSSELTGSIDASSGEVIDIQYAPELVVDSSEKRLLYPKGHKSLIHDISVKEGWEKIHQQNL